MSILRATLAASDCKAEVEGANPSFGSSDMKQLFFSMWVGIGLLAWLPQVVSAQVIATAVAEASWTIDSNTAVRGITLGSDDGALKLSLAPKVIAPDTRVTVTTYASEYFVTQDHTHRITPLYRIGIDNPGLSPGQPQGLVLTVEIRYPQEELGKKVLRAWDEMSGLWSDIPSKSIPERNVVRALIPVLSTYLAVFADDRVLESGVASWYNYKNCNCAASPDYPKGTKLKVTNIANRKSVVVRVNDYGPDRAQFPDRVIDLDRQAFLQIANPKHGVARVKVEPI